MISWLTLLQYILIKRESDNLLSEMRISRCPVLPYALKPVDTPGVFLSVDLHDIVEVLAKNTHENRDSVRMSQGFWYGPAQNDLYKEPRCPVPSETLPEPEKEPGRNVVRERLKIPLTPGLEIKRCEKTE
jgi:hypothetical protein